MSVSSFIGCMRMGMHGEDHKQKRMGYDGAGERRKGGHHRFSR